MKVSVMAPTRNHEEFTNHQRTHADDNTNSKLNQEDYFDLLRKLSCIYSNLNIRSFIVRNVLYRRLFQPELRMKNLKDQSKIGGITCGIKKKS